MRYSFCPHLMLNQISRLWVLWMNFPQVILCVCSMQSPCPIRLSIRLQTISSRKMRQKSHLLGMILPFRSFCVGNQENRCWMGCCWWLFGYTRGVGSEALTHHDDSAASVYGHIGSTVWHREGQWLLSSRRPPVSNALHLSVNQIFP